MRRHKKLATTTREVQRARLCGIVDATDAELAVGALASMGYGQVERKAMPGGVRVTFTRTVS